MARNTTSTRNGRPGPSLRLVSGPGITAEVRADEAEMEAVSLRADMKAAAARLRLIVMESIWSPDVAARLVRQQADRLEAQASSSESAA